jgi:hypothetical protein
LGRCTSTLQAKELLHEEFVLSMRKDTTSRLLIDEYLEVGTLHNNWQIKDAVVCTSTRMTYGFE